MAKQRHGKSEEFKKTVAQTGEGRNFAWDGFLY